MNTADRQRIAELLRDESRSFRSIAREIGISDWTVRRVARELDGDPRPMKSSAREIPDYDRDGSEAGGWIGLAMFVGFIALVVWFALRGLPPPEA